MGEGSSHGSGRVGSGRVRLFVGNRGSGRVGSGQRFAGSGRVQEKWPVDNSGDWDTLSHAVESISWLNIGGIILKYQKSC